MGRKPAGEEKLLNAEKQKRYCGKGETRVKKRKESRQKNAANNNTDKEQLVVSIKFCALSRSLNRAKVVCLRIESKRSLKRAKCSLPKDRAQK